MANRPVLATLLLATPLLGGCIVIPTNYTAPTSRHNVTAETAARLEPGVTRFDDVLLQFGEPDVASDDGHRLGYRWSKVRAIFVVGGYGSAAAGSFSKSSLLELTFDADDRLSSLRVVSEWDSANL